MQLQLKQCVLAVGALLFAGGVLAVPCSAGSTVHATRYVHCGSSKTPSTPTIQGAVNASSAGDTIAVCPGTYSENVAINGVFDGLHIVGEQGAKVKCPGNAGSGFDLHAYAVTIQGFDIEDCATGVSIERGFAGNTLRDLTIHSNGTGISINGSGYLNTVVDCEIFANSGDAIFDFEAGGDYFIDDEIHNNGGNGIQISTSGAAIGGFFSAVLLNNVSERNAGNGIYLNTSDDVFVQGNNESENGLDGIYLNTSNHNTLVANDTDQNGLNGTELSSTSTNNFIDGNRMEKNVTGVDFTIHAPSGANTVASNDCTTTGGSASCI